MTDPKDVCQSCSHPTHSGQCEVIKTFGDRCECGKPVKKTRWLDAPEVIQPNEINMERFIEGTDWDE